MKSSLAIFKDRTEESRATSTSFFCFFCWSKRRIINRNSSWGKDESVSERTKEEAEKKQEEEEEKAEK